MALTRRAAGDEARPVVEGLAVVLREHRTALLHFDEDDGLPDVVGEAGAAAVLGGLADAELGLAADIERARVAEDDEEAAEEDSRLAFFVAGDVLLRSCGEGGEFLSVAIGHEDPGPITDAFGNKCAAMSSVEGGAYFALTAMERRGRIRA